GGFQRGGSGLSDAGVHASDVQYCDRVEPGHAFFYFYKSFHRQVSRDQPAHLGPERFVPAALRIPQRRVSFVLRARLTKRNLVNSGMVLTAKTSTPRLTSVQLSTLGACLTSNFQGIAW